MDGRSSFEKERREKKDDKNVFTVCVRVFEYMYGMSACVAYPGMCSCIMEKKEKTAYLEYMVEKKFCHKIEYLTEVQAY